MKKIGLIGSGVSGLTTAILLQEAGYSVTIHAQEVPSNTTSAKAAAIWMPYIAEPRKLVNLWSRYSFSIFESLCREATSGVSMVDMLYLTPNKEKPNWEEAMPTHLIRPATAKELPIGYQYGYVATVPLIETPVYLDYLKNRFQNNQGRLIIEQINNITHLKESYDEIVNCSGLGAAKLCKDKNLYPVQGHIVKIEKRERIICCADDEGPNALAYIIPRSDCIVLGGTSDAGLSSLIPDEDKIKGILDRCQMLEPKIETLKVIKVEVGLRPARNQIRCEKEKTTGILHNYGHGGSGFTVSWGCAQEIVGLI